METNDGVARIVVGVLVTIQGTALWLGAVAHMGVEIALGPVVVAEPQILPAVLVEGGTGLLLFASGYAAFTGRWRAWTAVTLAQIVALGGVLLGIAAIAAGAGPHTTANALFHRAMVVLLVGGLAIVLAPPTRRAFGPSSSDGT